MSEDKGELDKMPAQLPSPSDTFLDKKTTLTRIDERLAKATSSEEIALWTRVRGEIIRQNESVKNSEHKRSLEKIQIIRKTSISGIAITIGVGLIISGLIGLGVLILAAAFYEIAPDYLKNVFPRKSRAEENESYQKLKYYILIVGLILTFIIGILLFVISKNETISEFEQGLFFIIGLTTMAALSAFKQYAVNFENTNYFLDEKYKKRNKSELTS
jgi:uncharacterized membrane protein